MPSVQKVHIDKALSNISIGYKNETYISESIFKSIAVEKQSDKYYVYGMESFRQHDDARAAGTEANEISWTLSDDAYFCEGHALRTVVADEEKQNADNEFELESDATELVSEGILLNKEVDAANKVLDANNYHADLKVTLGSGGTYKWSDYENSDPILDIAKAREAVHKKSGVRANTLVISEPVFNILRRHPKLLALVTGIKVGIIGEDIMKLAFGVDQILIGSALKSTAKKGQVAGGGLDPLSYIWGNSAVVAYIPTQPRKKQVALGYSFMWNKDGEGAVQVRKWYETGRRATVVEAERWYAHKMVSNVAGYLFSDAVTPLA